MAVPLDQVKKLREMTQVSFLECKNALEESRGDLERAVEILKKKGALSREKKAGRETGSGVIASYVHPGSKVGVLVDLRCETDFVARTEEFQKLAHELAMQVAAMQPLWVKSEEVSQEILENEKRIARESLAGAGKPERIVEEIVQGRLKKYCTETCLLNQPSIRNQDETVGEMIDVAVGKLGENIKVRRFCRFEV
ncbi:MAG: elongation factor Ts [Parcubacteria group bacterium]|nr:elongation factor Ts [Parcubacteria group bacterium]